MMKNENRDGLLKTLFTVIGALVSLIAVAALAYVLFKKFFQVTFECDEGDGGLAEDGDDPFADSEDAAFEPICCCDEEEESDEDDTHACGCAEEPEKAAE